MLLLACCRRYFRMGGPSFVRSCCVCTQYPASESSSSIHCHPMKRMKCTNMIVFFVWYVFAPVCRIIHSPSDATPDCIYLAGHATANHDRGSCYPSLWLLHIILSRFCPFPNVCNIARVCVIIFSPMYEDAQNQWERRRCRKHWLYGILDARRSTRGMCFGAYVFVGYSNCGRRSNADMSIHSIGLIPQSRYSSRNQLTLHYSRKAFEPPNDDTSNPVHSLPQTTYFFHYALCTQTRTHQHGECMRPNSNGGGTGLHAIA